MEGDACPSRECPLTPRARSQTSSSQASRGLARQQVADLTLFAFADGESVSEERYPADTVYVCLEGTLAVTRGGEQALVPAGSCLRVKEGVSHAVSGVGGSVVKFLQVNA